jgi:AcrR family transcriptional regulator
VSAAKRPRYHHGDLRAALITTAIQLIDEQGLAHFSVAEASRRLGVAPSAPYAHFSDRDDLLAAVMLHGLELFQQELLPELDRPGTANERLATVARTYVSFAAAHRALFRILFQLHIDKTRYPAIAAAEKPIDEAFRQCVRAISGDDQTAEQALAAAVEALVHGHAAMLLDGRFGTGRNAVRTAADSAQRSTLALAAGWTNP